MYIFPLWNAKFFPDPVLSCFSIAPIEDFLIDAIFCVTSQFDHNAKFEIRLAFSLELIFCSFLLKSGKASLNLK